MIVNSVPAQFLGLAIPKDYIDPTKLSRILCALCAVCGLTGR